MIAERSILIFLFGHNVLQDMAPWPELEDTNKYIEDPSSKSKKIMSDKERKDTKGKIEVHSSDLSSPFFRISNTTIF